MKSKNFFKIIALTLIFSIMLLSGCNAADVVDEIIGYDTPDYSLVEDYEPTKPINIAMFAKNDPEHIITQNGVIDVRLALLAYFKSHGEEKAISSLSVACRKNGIFCIFTDKENSFNLGVLSYDGDKFEYKLQTDQIKKGFSYIGATNDIAACSWTDDGFVNVAIIPFDDAENFSIFRSENKNEDLKAVYQGGNYEFIIETERREGITDKKEKLSENSESEYANVKYMYLFSAKDGIISKTVRFDKDGEIYVGAGENLAIVCTQKSGSWYLLREEGEYKTAAFTQDIHEEIIEAKYIKIIGDYLVIGNPCLETSKVFSFIDKDIVVEEKITQKVKDIAAGKTGNSFNVSYNKYTKTFIFEKGINSGENSETGENGERKSDEKYLHAEIDLYKEYDSPVVPEVLQTISVAAERLFENGLTEVGTFPLSKEDSDRNIFYCVYLDKEGNKIYCIFEFTFASEGTPQKIDYLGACGEGVGILNITGKIGIEIVLYD